MKCTLFGINQIRPQSGVNRDRVPTKHPARIWDTVDQFNYFCLLQNISPIECPGGPVYTITVLDPLWSLTELREFFYLFKSNQASKWCKKGQVAY